MTLRPNILVDSGAFSVWTVGKEMSFDTYARFLQDIEGYYWKAINLDVIPGKPGQRATQAQVELSAKQSFENAQRLVELGVDVMPVFHIGESFEWLDRIVQEGYDMVGLGGVARGLTTKQKQAWLDKVFTHLCGANGFPEIKVHGLGITSLPLLLRYPWYSTDSITWIKFAGNGTCLVPLETDTGWDFHNPLVIGMSSQQRDTQIAFNYITAGEAAQVSVQAWAFECGLTVQHLQQDYVARYICNAAYFTRLATSLSPRRWAGQRVGFFNTSAGVHAGRKTPLNSTVRIVLVHPYAPTMTDVLAATRSPDRLMSYEQLEQLANPAETFREYVDTGRLTNKKDRDPQDPLEVLRTTGQLPLRQPRVLGKDKRFAARANVWSSK